MKADEKETQCGSVQGEGKELNRVLSTFLW